MRNQGLDVADVRVLRSDMSAALASEAQLCGEAALDTETSGLDWARDPLRTIQVYVPGAWVEIIRVGTRHPVHLTRVITNPAIEKVFHYATFDLLFLGNVLDTTMARSVICTKVAAKLLYPGDHESQRLTSLTARYLGVPLDKAQQVSDWAAAELSAAQIAYAAEDVRHLPQLRGALDKDLQANGLLELARACWSHIPARVQLERRSLGDVFSY